MLELGGRFRARGLRVVGVSGIDPDDAAEEKKGTLEAAAEEKMDYPTFLDANHVFSKSNGIADIPAFVVVGKDGRVVYRHRGKLVVGSAEFAAMEKAIEQALGS